MLRRISLIVSALFLASMMLSWGWAPGNPDVEVVHAACGTPTNCSLDNTVTSALQVTHNTTAPSIVPVEPDSGETWEVNAVWATTFGAANCNCSEISDTVSVTVDWTGSGWSASCTGCDATNGPIRSVSVCAVDGCNLGPTTHGWAYMLIVDIDESVHRYCALDNHNYDAFLQRVEYETTSVDDGDKIETCDENGAVSPTSQTWTATDTGSFECVFNCSATPVYTSITYN